MRNSWLRVLLPVVVVLIWLVGAAVGGPTFGRLEEVSSNDAASFLPASAESTEAGELQQRFSDSDAIPAVIVAESDTAIEPRNLGLYEEIGVALGEVEGLEPPAAGAPAVAGPIPSEDGLAVQYIAFVSSDAELAEVVGELRTVLTDELPDGVTGYVTGPAGFTNDLVEAFGGIDGILLGVALGAVFVILLAVYRSVVLPFLVLLTSVFALATSILLVFGFAKLDLIQLTGQSQGILSILVIGAATDYALLLVARFREALAEHELKWDAMRVAYRTSVAPILASGATVILGLLCLLFSDLNSNRSLGPIAAIGIAFSLGAALTFLPALLLLFGRGAFWPLRPRYHPRTAAAAPRGRHAAAAGPTGLEQVRGLWRRVALLVAGRPRVLWIASLLLLVAGSLGLTQLQAGGVPQSALILAPSNAVDGQEALGRHFDAGSGSPVYVVAPEADADAALAVVSAQEGVSDAALTADPGGAAVVEDGRVLISGTLEYQADSDRAEDVVRELRTTLDDAGPDALVGGVSAVAVDTNDTALADLGKIIPIVLLVILGVLVVLLRSILAPVLLVASVALSNATALGVSALVFNGVFGFEGADASVPLFAFVFLVALGVDYNIFLMTRVREESLRIGTRPGILRGLGVTGGVITSAGVVLAATFAALGVIPILFLAQIAFIVAFGVLLDTVLVRSLLIPALAYDIGPKIWWPSKLGAVPSAR
ncbi:MMPL family transporter [Arthrobacter burdickii]|uniref:Efflux RND transporter permease subunit n=1 Tax=Arthrobacter burdickii TaxID=3035920 RepID=A0ABT8JYT3_9MICC|nr:efflux RND transporter permease subunit [Arthrobacter burdickii]MDN4610330.1 efflux RND transporter permease subunit [Arthrobacter burdickii]